MLAMAVLRLQWFGGIFFGVLLHGVDGLTRTACTREAQFDNPKKGYSLDGNILATVSVQNTADCVIECLQHPVCQSINFHESANPEHVCELNSKTHNDVTLTANSDVSYYGPAASQPNCKVDGPGECQNGGVCAMSCSGDPTLMCHCPDGRTGPTCEDKSVIYKGQDFAIVYPARSVEDYISVQDDHVQDFSSITVLLWIRTLESAKIALFDYLSANGDGSLVKQLRITYSPRQLSVKVQMDSGGNAREFLVPPINDGHWHHVGVTWSLGKYDIYLDGVSVYSGNDLGTNAPLQAGGKFVIGQVTKTGGSFFEDRPFRGKFSQVNVWDEILTAEEMKSISKNCYNDVGTILAWPTVLDNTHGNVHKEDPNSCRSLRQNGNYDNAMSATSAQASHIVSPDNVPSLVAFTISTWAKHSEYIRYVDYRNDGATLLAFRLHKDVLILEIAGADTKQARVPRYWKESPAYWHHIATTWSSATAEWKIYLDGSLVSIMHDVAASSTIPAGGQLLLGLGNPDNGDISMNGSLSRLNIWDYEVDGHTLSIMANKGPLFENGNVFAWYGVRSKIVGNLVFTKTPSDLYNSRAMADFQMTFPEGSAADYARLYGVFPNDLTTLCACFWFKLLKYYIGIFAYSSRLDNEEFTAFLYSSYSLDFYVGGRKAYIDTPAVKTSRWHFYCAMWKSSDGLLEVYKDGVHLQSKTVSAGRVIPGNGAIVLGQEVDSYAGGFSTSQAMKGELAGLNFWTELLTANEISGMAAGTINVNGDLLQWRDFRGSIHGAVSIKENSDFELPEYRVQKLRNDYCETKYPGTYARFVRNDVSYAWRCVRPSAMLDENMVYDIIGKSPSFYSRTAELLAIT